MSKKRTATLYYTTEVTKTRKVKYLKIFETDKCDPRLSIQLAIRQPPLGDGNYDLAWLFNNCRSRIHPTSEWDFTSNTIAARLDLLQQAQAWIKEQKRNVKP